jgi:hypothetical protein
MKQDPKKEKARFRWYWHPLFIEGGYWAPMNYNAETIHLMKVYGSTNTGRRFKE